MSDTGVGGADIEHVGLAALLGALPDCGLCLVLERMGEALCIARESDDVIVFANDRCSRLLGYEPGELLGQCLHVGFTPGEDGAARQSFVDAELDAAGEVVTETRRLRKDGTAVWTRATKTRIVEAGAAALKLVVLTDITARKEAEADAQRSHDGLELRVAERTAELVRVNDELRDQVASRSTAEQELGASQARFSSLAASGILGIFVDGHGGVVRDANDAFLKLLGYSRHDLDAGLLDDAAINLPEWSAANQHARDQLSAVGHASQYEKEFRRKDGSRVAALVGASMLDAKRAIGFALDISAAKRGEAELSRSRASFDALHRSSAVGIAITDAAGCIEDANDAFLHIVGYSRADFDVGLVSWASLSPPAIDDGADTDSERQRLSGYVDPLETDYVRKDGSRARVRVDVVAVDARSRISVVADLTEQRRAQEALSRTQEHLRQAQKMEAVGRLAGGVAHDFNNMLSVILTYSQLVMQDLKVGDPMREDIREINKAAVRSAELTQQLLLFSRHQVAATKVLDLGAVLRGMEKILQRVLGEDVVLVATVAPELGRVRADPTHIEQVVMNLAVNARDAMPRGGRLTLTLSNVRACDSLAAEHPPIREGDYVKLEVTDTGSGMSRETVTHVFEPFFTTKEQGKGTGLGLATVFGVVQQSGGSISVDSTPGRGTTFRIYLPSVDAIAESDPVDPMPETLRGTETILLVEDEALVRTMAADVLRRSGYHVLDAQSAGEGLLLCEQYEGEIALLLTDVVMPSMSGPDLAKRLAKTRSGMRILCMSGYNDDRKTVLGAANGLAFLAKPLTPLSLTRKIRQVLDSAPPLPTPPYGVKLSL